MIQTAISVARNCGMVHKRDRIIIAHGTPPDKTQAARLEWEEAEIPALSDGEGGEEGGATSDDATDNEVLHHQHQIQIKLLTY